MLAMLVVLAGVVVPSEQGQKPLLVRRQEIQIRIKDQVARATLDEVFENTTDRALEGNYLLPLPDGAAVSGFATWVDGNRVDSRIEEKKQAEKTYGAAKGEHKQPALLQQTEEHLFRASVDGIPAGGTKRIEASWAQILPYEGGLVTLRVPLVPKNVIPEPIGELRMRVEAEDQKRIAEVKLVSAHAAKIERSVSGGFILTLNEKDARPDAELVVTWRMESSRLGLSFVPFKPQGEESGYFLLLASPQELTSAQDIVHKDVVFVFDTSGSMGQARKIDQAREALKRCLSNLNAEDRFAVVAFSDSLNPFSNHLQDASPANVQRALGFAEELRSGGGTDIHSALQYALGLQGDGGRPRVIVFMTDGIPETGIRDPREIAHRFRERNQGATRLFAFGVGSDVNRTFLEQLGSENRGGSGFVMDGQDIDSVVGGFYAKIARPVLSDLSLDFGDAVTVAMQYPDVLPDLYKGSQLVLVGRYRGAGKVEAALLGSLNGKKIRLPFAAKFPARQEENTFVARLWAQKRIDFLLAQNRLQGERSESKDEVIALSTRYQIVTPYTSLVAVQAPAQRLAQVFPARVRPGDPVVTVRAPRDARSVRVHLPFGGAPAQARWDDEREAWSARFLVPSGTADGSYPICVEITARDGSVEKLPLSIGIDTHAPQMLAWASAVKAGQPLRLRAVATLAPADLWQVLTARDDTGEALKSLFDVRRVTARLWDGREVDLPLEGLGFSALVETGSTLAPGSYPVVLVAQDFAGNSSRSEIAVEVAP
jgi:Ca-activated chloride channel family protein